MSDRAGRLAEVHEQRGHYDDAIAALDKMDALSGRPSTPSVVTRARILARGGRMKEARRLLADVPQGSQRAAVLPALGDHDAAFTSLSHGLDRREAGVLFLKSDPNFDGLHGDARWAAVLRRMNLGG
jgi:hypothetical protein